MVWDKQEEHSLNCTVCNRIGWIYNGCVNVTLRGMNRSMIWLVKLWHRAVEDAFANFRHVHYTKFWCFRDHL